MSFINEPRVAPVILRIYIGLAAFIGFLALLFLYSAFYTPAGPVMLGVSFTLIVLLEPLFLLLIRSLRNTRYILTDHELTINTSVLIGGSKNIQLESIKSVEKTLYPLGFKLFGASFHGGYYSIPGLGRTFIAVTNFEDAVLIRTTGMSYVISPKNPLEFIELLKTKITNQST